MPDLPLELQIGAVAPGEMADCRVQLWRVLAGGWRKQMTESYPKPEVTGAEREAQPSAGKLSGVRQVFSTQNLSNGGEHTFIKLANPSI